MSGTGLFLAAMAVLGAAVGALLRHTTGAVLTTLAAGLVPVLFSGMFPEAVRTLVLDHLPGPAGSRIGAADPAPEVGNYMTLLAWVFVVSIAAWLMLRRRDARPAGRTVLAVLGSMCICQSRRRHQVGGIAPAGCGVDR